MTEDRINRFGDVGLDWITIHNRKDGNNMGLLAFIYRHDKDDCSAGGINSRCDRVVIVNPDNNGHFNPTDDIPAVLLVRGPGKNIIAVPAERRSTGIDEDWVELKGKGCRMDGGTFIYTCDSRFSKLLRSMGRDALSSYDPISLHDRFEC